MLGSVLKQAVGALDEIPEKIVKGFLDTEVIGGQFLQAILASRRTVHLYDSDTLMAARSQPNDNWGSVGNGAKHR